MTGVCSWSGGKDSCLAWARATEDRKVSRLLTMVVDEGESVAQGYAETFRLQAESLDITMRQESVTWDTYEARFERALAGLDAEFGVFGTVDVPEHRAWVEATCEVAGVTPLFPLWGDDPVDLYRAVLDRGFEAVVVKLDATLLDADWLGRPIHEDFLDHLRDRGAHPMGEGGEYHTVVVDGPGFDSRVPVRVVGSKRTGDYRIAELGLPDGGEKKR